MREPQQSMKNRVKFWNRALESRLLSAVVRHWMQAAQASRANETRGGQESEAGRAATGYKGKYWQKGQQERGEGKGEEAACEREWLRDPASGPASEQGADRREDTILTQKTARTS